MTNTYEELKKARELTFVGGPDDGVTAFVEEIFVASMTGNPTVVYVDEDGNPSSWTWRGKEGYKVVGDKAFYSEVLP